MSVSGEQGAIHVVATHPSKSSDTVHNTTRYNSHNLQA